MKKRMSSLVMMLFLVLSSAAQKHSFNNLIGRWESADGAGIEVVDSSKIFLLYAGDKKRIIFYQTDFEKSPCWFDFTIKDSANNVNIKSLLLFVNDDMLQWQMFEDARPSNFTAEKDNMVYLRRKK